MTSLLDAPAGLLGSQSPRIFTAPAFRSSAGADAVDLAAVAGLHLDPWQAMVLEHSLGERPDGKWSAFECGVVVPRQNGKGSIIEARELAGLFILRERLILHSAHEFKTAAEGFRRIEALIDGSSELRKKVKRVMRGTGERGIELKSGQRLLFIARSKGSGRGMTADCVIFDEAYNLGGEAMGAMLPTLSSIPNPQVWYLSSAGHPDSEQLHAVRARGMRGGPEAGALAYFEWSAPDDCDPGDSGAWAMANPALGRRISAEFVDQERHAMPAVEFARERLGIWEQAEGGGVFPPGSWATTTDGSSSIVGPLTFGVDVSVGRETGSVGVAGRRPDGVLHVENVRNQPGTDWIVPYLAEITARNGGSVVVDPASPAGSLIDDLQKAYVRVHVVSARDYAQGCGWLFDQVRDGDVRHLPQPELDMAVAGAKTRELAGAFAWDRRKPSSDITPLVAVTLAAWGFRTFGGADLAGSVW
jgi:hypothetical protein